MPNIRFHIIERRIMEAELELDGLSTHNNFFHCMNPIHAKKIKRALSAVRSARDIMRNDLNGRQLTLYTRGKKINRKGVGWYYNVQRADWKCGCNQPFTLKGKYTENGREPKIKPRKEKPIVLS